jgi:hypothetical protein
MNQSIQNKQGYSTIESSTSQAKYAQRGTTIAHNTRLKTSAIHTQKENNKSLKHIHA